MPSYSTVFAGQSGGTPRQWFTATSATFTTPVAGKYRITLVGVGSGASNAAAGSSGAIAQSLVTLAAGVTITCAHGAVGTGGATPVAGGTSTVAAAGLTTLTCTGGLPATPGTASGGNVFNRNGVAGAAATQRGGSSVAVYGTGYAATGAGGAGTGEGGPLAGFGNQGGGAIPGVIGFGGFLNGRLLQPAGSAAPTATDSIGRPGGGGLSDALSFQGSRGGMFAGGGSGSTSGGGSAANGGRGGVGGGGGGTGVSGGVGGNGGEALTIIEWTEE